MPIAIGSSLPFDPNRQRKGRRMAMTFPFRLETTDGAPAEPAGRIA